MSTYLVQVSYTSTALSALIAKPQNRAPVVAKVIENLGGKALGTWLSFGDYDTVTIVELPDTVSAAAFAMAISAGGSCKAVKTTPLIGPEDGMAALKKAAKCGYKPVAVR